MGEEEARWDQGLTFDIAVQDPAGMEVFQPFQGLAQVVEGSVLWQTAHLLDELAQGATWRPMASLYMGLFQASKPRTKAGGGKQAFPAKATGSIG